MDLAFKVFVLPRKTVNNPKLSIMSTICMETLSVTGKTTIAGVSLTKRTSMMILQNAIGTGFRW